MCSQVITLGRKTILSRIDMLKQEFSIPVGRARSDSASSLSEGKGSLASVKAQPPAAQAEPEPVLVQGIETEEVSGIQTERLKESCAISLIEEAATASEEGPTKKKQKIPKTEKKKKKTKSGSKKSKKGNKEYPQVNEKDLLCKMLVDEDESKTRVVVERVVIGNRSGSHEIMPPEVIIPSARKFSGITRAHSRTFPIDGTETARVIAQPVTTDVATTSNIDLKTLGGASVLLCCDEEKWDGGKLGPYSYDRLVQIILERYS